LFEKAIILGAENDSLSLTWNPNETSSNGSIMFPFCTLQRTVSKLLMLVMWNGKIWISCRTRTHI